jgi:hypothetical protein
MRDLFPPSKINIFLGLKLYLTRIMLRAVYSVLERL